MFKSLDIFFTFLLLMCKTEIVIDRYTGTCLVNVKLCKRNYNGKPVSCNECILNYFI